MSASMSTFPSQENRPLKKPRLCMLGPDVYPQELRQKEVNSLNMSILIPYTSHLYFI